MLNKRTLLFIILALFVITASAFGVIAFRHLGTWLIVSDPLPKKLDVIFTFSGGSNRAPYAKELFIKYPESFWVLSYPNSSFLKKPENKDLDTSRITIVDTCTSTHSELLYLSDWLNKHASNKDTINIGLVSSPYHMRRIKLNAHKFVHNKNCTFYYLPVPFEQDDFSGKQYQNWWKNKYLQRVVTLEIKKIVYYGCKY